MLALLFQARSLLYQFRLLPRIPCSLHDLCKLCGPGMWDSRYIPVVECSGEHPDSQSCPYGGTSTPQPSSPSPSSSPNHSPTPLPDGKRGSKKRDIFNFRKQSWGGSFCSLFLSNTYNRIFLFFFFNSDFSFGALLSTALPLLLLTFSIACICNEGGSESERSEVKRVRSPRSRTDNHQAPCRSGATSGLSLPLAWHSSTGVVGIGEVTAGSLTSWWVKKRTGESFTELELGLLKMFLGSHNETIVWMSNIMCVFKVPESFWHEIKLFVLKNICFCYKYLAILSLHEQFFTYRGHNIFVVGGTKNPNRGEIVFMWQTLASLQGSSSHPMSSLSCAERLLTFAH